MKLIIFILASLPVIVSAQTDTTTYTFSKLYFPFDYGFSYTQNKYMQPGSIIKTGLEYRPCSTGWFVRFNFDNRSNNYTIIENQTTNITNGKVNLNDYTIGVGYRTGKKKIKTFGLIQSGITVYDYNIVKGTPSNFKLVEQQANSSIIKITVGLEYYIAPNAALILETAYILQPEYADFWCNNMSMLAISFGLTTTLF